MNNRPKRIYKDIRIEGVIDGKPVCLNVADLQKLTGASEHSIRNGYYTGLSGQEIIDKAFASEAYQAFVAEKKRMRLANKFLFGRH